jgi:PAS domain S-box-containing protein
MDEFLSSDTDANSVCASDAAADTAADTETLVSNILLHIGHPVIILRYVIDDLQIVNVSPETNDIPDLMKKIKEDKELLQIIDRVNSKGERECIEISVNSNLIKVKVSKLNNNGYLLLDIDLFKTKLNNELDNLILNNIDGHIIINQNGVIIKINTVVERIFGYTRFELQGNNVSLLMTEPHASKHNEYLQKYDSTGQSKILHTVREVQARRKNGEIFPLELTANEVYLNNQKYYIAVVRDLSIVKKYNSFESITDKYLRHTIFNKIPSGLLIISSPQLKILLANTQFLEMFNFQNDHILNKLLIEAFPSLYNHEQAYAILLKTMKTGEMQILKNVKIMTVDVSILSFPIDNQTFGIFFYKPCESELKSSTVPIDLLERSRRDTAVFLSNIGNEIRIGINTIFGNLDLLRANDHLTPDQEKYIENTNGCATDLINIIDDILVYSQIELDEFKLDLQPFRFQQLINECLDTIRTRAAEKNIQLPISINKNVPEFVIGDCNKIKRIIQNVLVNAVKYTEVGKIVTRVDVVKNKLRRKSSRPINSILEKLSPRRTESQPKYLLNISITDTGIGIPKSMHENIFKPFVKVKEKNQMYGTGLGLYICKWYVEKLGGSIKLDSNVGVGSTFYIEIPVNEDKNISRMTKHSSNFIGKNILIIDPIMADRMSISKLLMGWNVSTFMCENLEEMRVYLKNQSLTFSIVLMNTTLIPEMTSEHKKYLEGIPVIGLDPPLDTSVSNSAGSDSGESGGSNENDFECAFVFTKPVEESKLYSTFVKLLFDRNETNCIALKKKLRILVIDDNLQNMNVISGQLNQMGYTNVSKMSNGIELIKELKKSDELNYDIILMDYYLPKFTGDTLTQIIHKKIKDEFKRPVIVGMTASTSVETKQKAFAAGVDAFLLKPLNRKELDTLLVLIMKKKGLIN